MKVQVDLDRCEGHGMCAFAAPDVFDLDDEGVLHYDPAPPDARRGDVENAVRSCPAGAISIEFARGGPASPAAGADRVEGD